MTARRAVLLGLSAAAVAAVSPARARADAAELWRRLADGEAVAVMRHASAPGTGDPDGFRVDDCGTQRNLSADGRAQAERIGAAFRAAGVGRARVLSSQWCRCLDTARLLGLGPVEPFPALNSLFGESSDEAAQTAEVRRLLAARRPGDAPLVLVSHQANITALTDVYPTSGEIVVVAPGPSGLSVLGRLAPP